MKTPVTYRETYDAMPIKKRKMVLALLKKWGGWTKTTAYRKMAGESVTPLEQVMLEGIFAVYAKREEAEQLKIAFEWSGVEKCPKMKLQKFA